MAELELKLQVPSERRLAVLQALRRDTLQRLHLQAHYHDTADGLLGANGFALRVRREGRRWVQTLKGRTGDAARRDEHEVDLGLRPAGAPPACEPARHHGSAVGHALHRLLADHGDPPLAPVYATDVWRCSRMLSHGGSRIDAALDEGAICADGERRPVCELEFELKSGEPAALFALAARWSERHGLWLDFISKGQRGQLLALGLAHAQPVKAEAPDLDGKLPAPAVVRRIVAACLAQILPNASEVAAGSDDPDHVHQLRIGIRRLRTALRELAALAPGFDPDWDATLATTFRTLGEQRDAQVLAGTMTPRLAEAGAPLTAWAGAATPAASAAEQVRDARFQRVLLDVLAFTHADDAQQPDIAQLSGVSPRQLIAARLRTLHRKVARDADRFEALDGPARHRVRKRLKRLRYLAEFASSLYRAPKVRRYLEALRPAQEALGLHNDEAVALANFHQAVAHDARAWFAVGWLQAQQKVSARACRKALARVARAGRFWRDKPG